MSWRHKAVFAAGVLALVSVGYFARRHSDERIRRDMHAKAQALKEEVEHRFPVGTAQSHVIEYLRSQAGEFRSEQANDYWLSIGQEPSRVWYCGPWEVGIRVRFKDNRLVDTAVDTWGLNCL
jgi:hypothetical protein